jgi:hypothetical protein
MRVFDLAPTWLLAAALAAPAAPLLTQAQDAAPLELFPTPTTALEIQLAPDATPSLYDVLVRFEQSAAHHLHMSARTRAILQSLDTGLSTSVRVEPQDSYSFVSSLLCGAGFQMAELRSEEPRLLTILDINSEEQERARSLAVAIELEELPRYERYPSILTETTMTLEGLDARQAANSMRAALNDPRLQQILPISESSLLLVGTGPQVSSWVRHLRTADAREVERVEAARAAAKAAAGTATQQ